MASRSTRPRCWGWISSNPGSLETRSIEADVLGGQRRIAVKVIDERGNERMVVREPD